MFSPYPCFSRLDKYWDNLVFSFSSVSTICML